MGMKLAPLSTVTFYLLLTVFLAARSVGAKIRRPSTFLTSDAAEGEKAGCKEEWWTCINNKASDDCKCESNGDCCSAGESGGVSLCCDPFGRCVRGQRCGEDKLFDKGNIRCNDSLAGSGRCTCLGSDSAPDWAKCPGR